VSRLINKSSIRYLIQRPWQAGLSILGIVLGVAVVISIDLANQSASKAFELSMESVAGKATHHIVGSPSELPDSLYFKLRLEHNIRNIAPIVEGFVTTESNPPRTFTLLGVDPFVEQPFRPFLSNLHNLQIDGLSDFFTRPGTVLISSFTAKQMGLTNGDEISIRVDGVKKYIKILFFTEFENNQISRALESVLIADIASAQEIMNMIGKLSRIDLIIPDTEKGKTQLERINDILPSSAAIIRSETRSKTAGQLVEAFKLNLTAMSLLALVVGMFLIYNTMTFSVVQRRTYIGLLRSIGVTRKEIFSIILNEAIFLGLIGSIIGIFLGMMLAKGMVQLVSQTINDLYFVLNVRELQITPFSFFKGFLLGVGASFFSALKPAREATSAPPRVVISRSILESKTRKKIPLYTIVGTLFLVLGIIFLIIPGKNIIIGFGSILLIILGFTFYTPLAIVIFMRFLHPILGNSYGILARMASKGIETQISRTTVAIAALGIAVSASVGVSTMTKSMRATIVHWLETTLEADIYISPPSLVARRNDATLNPGLVEKITKINGVKNVNFYRAIQVQSDNDIIQISGLNITKPTFDHIRFKEGDPTKIWNQFQKNEAIIVTEPYAYKNNVKLGSMILLPTNQGIQEFQVVGIYYDYSSDIGFVTMSFTTLAKYWDVKEISGITVYLEDPANNDQIINEIRGIFSSNEEILVRSNRFLLDTSIEIFDRTFLITKVLQILAIFVAFIGILSALMAMQLERMREFGVLRANGLTPKQLWKLVTLQTGLMGFSSGLLALPMGNVLALILIYIINKRSFGWTLQFQFLPEVMVQAIVLSLAAAIIAGIYPAFKMAKTSPALALREE